MLKEACQYHRGVDTFIDAFRSCRLTACRLLNTCYALIEQPAHKGGARGAEDVSESDRSSSCRVQDDSSSRQMERIACLLFLQYLFKYIIIIDCDIALLAKCELTVAFTRIIQLAWLWSSLLPLSYASTRSKAASAAATAAVVIFRQKTINPSRHTVRISSALSILRPRQTG